MTALSTVPTLDMKNGLLALPSTSAYQLYNPYTGAPLPRNASNQYDLSKLPQWSGSAALLGRAIASYYPVPTSSNTAGGVPSSNYVFSRTRVEDMNGELYPCGTTPSPTKTR